MVIKVGN